jgi:hypothetical protein
MGFSQGVNVAVMGKSPGSWTDDSKAKSYALWRARKLHFLRLCGQIAQFHCKIPALSNGLLP